MLNVIGWLKEFFFPTPPQSEEPIMEIRSKLKRILSVAGFLSKMTSTQLDDQAVAWLNSVVNDDAEWALVVQVLAFLGVKIS